MNIKYNNEKRLNSINFNRTYIFRVGCIKKSKLIIQFERSKFLEFGFDRSMVKKLIIRIKKLSIYLSTYQPTRMVIL